MNSKNQNIDTPFPIWCENCKESGYISLGNTKKPHFVICERCNAETSQVWCDECRMGGDYVRDLELRPKDWTCTSCKNTYVLPDEYYENPIPLRIGSSYPEAPNEGFSIQELDYEKVTNLLMERKSIVVDPSQPIIIFSISTLIFLVASRNNIILKSMFWVFLLLIFITASIYFIWKKEKESEEPIKWKWFYELPSLLMMFYICLFMYLTGISWGEGFAYDRTGSILFYSGLLIISGLFAYVKAYGWTQYLLSKHNSKMFFSPDMKAVYIYTVIIGALSLVVNKMLMASVILEFETFFAFFSVSMGILLWFFIILGIRQMVLLSTKL